MADTGAPASTPSPPPATNNNNDGPRPRSARPPLHAVLPPLLLGTATFNTQYVDDPHSMPYRDIVARAIALGIRGFDTSPYYGPSETLLGAALDALMNPAAAPSRDDDDDDDDDGSEPRPSAPLPLPRSSVFLATKAGRIAASEFDYSPAWIRASVRRSLQRLHTSYLDLVYTHDVEFVSPAEVLAAVRELRRLRDEEGIVRYVGISGFPVDVLCRLAEMIRAETGEPLDAVLSYGHFTVQNRRLGLPWLEEEADGKGEGGVDGVAVTTTTTTTPNSSSSGSSKRDSPLARLKRAGVDVVLNASILGMGLLTSRGIPTDPRTPSRSAGAGGDDEAGKTPPPSSPLARWHPSPPGLRLACKGLAQLAAAAGERMEAVAIRWALGEWARVAAAAGVAVDLSAPGVPGRRKVGATVCGVTSIEELEETAREWRGVLSGLGEARDSDETTGSARWEKVTNLVRKELWPALGPWIDYAWESPGQDFVNKRQQHDCGKAPDEGVVTTYENTSRDRQNGQSVYKARL